MKGLKVILGMGVIVFFWSSCGGGGSSSSNSLASAYPSGMAVVSPLADQSTTASLIVPFMADENEVINDAMTYAEKQAAINAILNATNLEDCFDINVITLRDEQTVSCFGPTIDLGGTHPDDPGTDLSLRNDELPQGDVGLWADSVSDGTSCLAAKVNAEFFVIEGRVDFAMMTMASAICYANNSGLTLPSEGQSLDITTGYTAALNANLDDVTFPPDSFLLSRLANTSDGNPVYQMTVSGTSTENSGMPVTMTLKHIPTSSDNSTYKGLLQMTYLTDNLASGNCGLGQDHTLAATVLYQKASSTDIRFRFKQAVFCGDAEDSEIFNDGGEIDGTNKYLNGGCGTEATPAGWGDDYTLTVMNMDPTTGYGNFTYAWQAGSCDQNTRVFKTDITATGGSDGGPGGCGYFGFGQDASTVDTNGTATIDGMICNWTGPGSESFGNKTVLELVQKQCVTLDESVGLFISDSTTLNIDYAPTLNCTNPTSSLTCDGTTCDIAHDLLDIGQMSAITQDAPEAL